MKFINFKKLMLGIIIAGLTAPASAAVVCTVDVKRVLIYGSGVVNVLHSGRNNYTVVCSLKNERKGVSIPTCAMWASNLQSAKDNGEKVIFYYNDSLSYSSCADLPIYGGAPAPIYIGKL